MLREGLKLGFAYPARLCPSLATLASTSLGLLKQLPIHFAQAYVTSTIV